MQEYDKVWLCLLSELWSTIAAPSLVTFQKCARHWNDVTLYCLVVTKCEIMMSHFARHWKDVTWYFLIVVGYDSCPVHNTNVHCSPDCILYVLQIWIHIGVLVSIMTCFVTYLWVFSERDSYIIHLVSNTSSWGYCAFALQMMDSRRSYPIDTLIEQTSADQDPRGR